MGQLPKDYQCYLLLPHVTVTQILIPKQFVWRQLLDPATADPMVNPIFMELQADTCSNLPFYHSSLHDTNMAMYYAPANLLYVACCNPEDISRLLTTWTLLLSTSWMSSVGTYLKLAIPLRQDYYPLNVDLSPISQISVLARTYGGLSHD